ncbi:hypothetical protein A2215_02585 [Candidatus Berkelbacteria bacterium RIFOXYA2_FULL_43_10]|uniref:Uncharacterized protein n=1 Tax=Candidatus Berkelbacteria bacterium RIFOXYA2_FULL_43_10 TaxID=1797472 RepID=A0A1F5EDP9_9BACT|nr:MAG: hypothetical protein A2215_02585 [Candidatus Berkelbacteria bacterium RIFOXYA2_FULL_43_10]
MATSDTSGEFPVDTPVEAEIVWGKNDRGEGVVWTHSTGMIVFPSHTGRGAPPCATRALVRDCQPQVGDREKCIVVRRTGSNTGFAYPVGLVVKTDEYEIVFQVIGEDNVSQVIVIPNWGSATVKARRDDDGAIVITVKRPK